MNIRIIGTITEVHNAVSGKTDKGEWYLQNFTIETVETNTETNQQYTSEVIVTCRGKEHCDKLASLKGSMVALSCNLSAKEGKDKRKYNSTIVFKAEKVKK